MEKSSKMKFRSGDVVSINCIVKAAFTDSGNNDRLELAPCSERHAGTFYVSAASAELTGPKHEVGDWVEVNYLSNPTPGQIKAIVDGKAWVDFSDGDQIHDLESLDRAIPMPPLSEAAVATLEERELSHKTIQGEVVNG